MRYILHSMRILLRSATQYRASFLLQVLGQVVMTAGDLMAVLVLLDRFTHMGQWSPAEVLFFFGVMQISFSVVECVGRGISTFASYVGSGEFDTFLLRPKPLFVQVLCARLDPRRVGTTMLGIGALIVSSNALKLVWTGEKALLLLLSLTGSILLLMGLFTIEATFSFFSVRSIEMVNVLTYGGRQTCQYPVDLYPRPIRLLFSWVAPFALCMHVPVSVILGRPMMNAAPWLAALAPLSGAVFFLIVIRLWYWGVRHYRSTGS